MLDDPKLLVVDDEEVICQGCRRVFSRQGFAVDISSDAANGLDLAIGTDYAAILLDMKMPNMDGIQFLEQLRKTRPDTPVILMTGYPSIPNAASAMRFGAADYVTKPFTPEEITKAVQRLVRRQARAESTVAEIATPAAETLFWNESWCQKQGEDSMRVGAVLPRAAAANATEIRLPRIGEVVYQGLPLAGVVAADKTLHTVPAPLSGVIVAVNESLTKNPAALLADPCGEGWIAAICPTRIDEEIRGCAARRLILVGTDRSRTADCSKRLAALGCDVRPAATWDEVAPMLAGQENPVVAIDGASLGESGPEFVGRIKTAAPAARVVVVAAPDSKEEAAYREHRIFFYAMEPFCDNEIVDVLDAAFKAPAPAAPPARHINTASEPVSRMAITNRNGTKVRLLASPGLLRQNDGLCWQIKQRLLTRLFPLETTPGEASINPLSVLAAAGSCDRLLVLLAKDMGRLPGTLVHDTKAEFMSVSGENADRVAIWVVQTNGASADPTAYDNRTAAALAEHIVREMASC